MRCPRDWWRFTGSCSASPPDSIRGANGRRPSFGIIRDDLTSAAPPTKRVQKSKCNLLLVGIKDVHGRELVAPASLPACRLEAGATVHRRSSLDIPPRH